MLVLTRRHGERILIGDDITITIVRINHESVRVGIDAPRDTTILREELLVESSQPLQPATVAG